MNRSTRMQLTIDRFERDRVVLRTNAGQELVVPRSEIPSTTREGDVLTVSFDQDAAATDERAQRAKDILNEILGDTNNESAANPANAPNRTNL